MISAISGGNPYLNYYQYRNSVRAEGTSEPQVQAAEKTRAAGRTLVITRPSNPDAPVEPVEAVKAVRNESSNGLGQLIPFLRQGADPAELAVRMRMQPYDSSQEAGEAAQAGEASQEAGGIGIEDVYKTIEEGKCETCEQRKYQDGSDDPGVSFKTASHIAPEQAATVVKGHEMEHVVREQASAEREDRKVVSQSVSIHTDICPECGKVYVSGGTTRTVTAAETQTQAEQDESMQERRSFFAVA